MKFSSCCHLHDNFKQLQILSIFELIISPKRLVQENVSAFDKSVLLFFSGNKAHLLMCFFQQCFQRQEINKGPSKVCLSRSCFTGFCATHCVYGPQKTLCRIRNIYFKEPGKKKHEAVEGLFWQGQREINPVPRSCSKNNLKKKINSIISFSGTCANGYYESTTLESISRGLSSLMLYFWRSDCRVSGLSTEPWSSCFAEEGGTV